MKPIEKFEASLGILQSRFKFIGQNVFDKNYRYDSTFYTILVFFLLTHFCQICIILNDSFEMFTRFSCTAISIGVAQVSYLYRCRAILAKLNN